MPKATINRNSDEKDLSQWSVGKTALADALFTAMSRGAYVGVYHSWGTGINLKLLSGQHSELFTYADGHELNTAAIEISDQLDEWARQDSAKPDQKARKRR